MTGTTPITREDAIKASKTIRQKLDEILQIAKQHRNALDGLGNDSCIIKSEVIAQHMLSVRAIEEAIMRQGMTLKNIGNFPPTPIQIAENGKALYDRSCEIRSRLGMDSPKFEDLDEPIRQIWIELANPEQKSVYAGSYDPQSTHVAPVADGLKL